jgi:alanine dehydrogenase
MGQNYETLEAGGYFKKISVSPSLLAITQESVAQVKKEKKILVVGIPRESSSQERRVPLTPTVVALLVNNGAEVIIEHHAGLDAGFSDKEYSEAGAIISYSKVEVFEKADIIVKIERPNYQEIEYLRNRQILISALHLGSLTTDFLKAIIQKNVTAIGYEFLRAEDGGIPIMQMMSEIAGINAIHIAAELMTSNKGGKGMLLGGITGVPPTVVTIIGAGTVGFNAARSALALGATVKVIDDEVYKLRRLEEKLGTKIYTAVAQPQFIEEAVVSSDVIIGAIYKPGQKTPCLVTEEMIMKMKEGSVAIDIAIDQGGCFETSRPTTHENPTFVKHGVIHYCVPNIASRVPHTSSIALSNILGSILLKIINYGGIGVLQNSTIIKNGIYCHHKHITNKYLAKIFGMDYIDISLLHASNF